MDIRFRILIADRNPRIRQFLKREFVSDGYHVLLARDSKEVASAIQRDNNLDLLVMDDEILTPDESQPLELLRNRIPPLPFIIHGYLIGDLRPKLASAAAALVKKTGNLEELKRAVKQVLHSEYPRMFDCAAASADSSR